MVCLGLEPGAAGWKVQTNPLSYGGTPGIPSWYLIKKERFVKFSRSVGRLQKTKLVTLLHCTISTFYVRMEPS